MTGPNAFRLERRSERLHHICVIDGPNVSNLSNRSKKMYGPSASAEALQSFVSAFANAVGVKTEHFMSNYEGAILEFIHESANRADGYIINPAGLTSTSRAVPFALYDTKRPVMEVHFANIKASPSMPRGSIIGPSISNFTPYVSGICMGMREYSYIGALIALTLALDDETFLVTE